MAPGRYYACSCCLVAGFAMAVNAISGAVLAGEVSGWLVSLALAANLHT